MIREEDSKLFHLHEQKRKEEQFKNMGLSFEKNPSASKV